jgi:hypothetical protein
MALQSEANYPWIWDDMELRPSTFEAIVPCELAGAFYVKEQEYLTPVRQRIHCNFNGCTAFIGRKGDAQYVSCSQCLRFYCGMCGEMFGNGQHECNEEESDEALRLPQDWVRGQHYQQCPSCMGIFDLWDGCNHVKCKCGKEFCFICGQRTFTSWHWRSGTDGCPRYRHPNDPRPGYVDDRPVALNPYNNGIAPSMNMQLVNPHQLQLPPQQPGFNHQYQQFAQWPFGDPYNNFAGHLQPMYNHYGYMVTQYGNMGYRFWPMQLPYHPGNHVFADHVNQDQQQHQHVQHMPAMHNMWTANVPHHPVNHVSMQPHVGINQQQRRARYPAHLGRRNAIAEPLTLGQSARGDFEQAYQRRLDN